MTKTIVLFPQLTNGDTAKRVQQMMEYFPRPPEFAQTGAAQTGEEAAA